MTGNRFRFFERGRGGRPVALAAAAVFFLCTGVVMGTTDPPADVTVRENKGIYTVEARFLVDQPPAAVRTVLTDYAEIPRFMPDVRSSVVLERTIGRAVVEQEAVSGVMMFSKRVHLVLEIDEQADTLVFKDRCGRSFKKYEGAWRLAEHYGQTAVLYELTAEPAFDVPGLVLKRLLRRDSGQMIERLRREIATRSVSTPSADRR